MLLDCCWVRLLYAPFVCSLLLGVYAQKKNRGMRSSLCSCAFRHPWRIFFFFFFFFCFCFCFCFLSRALARALPSLAYAHFLGHFIRLRAGSLF
jgi:multidrug transporter EmrE-like cation transporter